MRRKLFATLGIAVALALLVYLPGVPRRAKQARIERARVFPTTPGPGAFERQLLQLGCASVVVLPLKNSLAHALSDRHVPQWWVSCQGPVRWALVATASQHLSGGAVVETDDRVGQLDAHGDVLDSVPILRGEHPHYRPSAATRVLSFLRAYVGW